MSNGWIPVAERLPGHREFIESYDPSNFGADRATTLYYSLTGRWYDEQGNPYKVIAWQKIPETYKG